MRRKRNEKHKTDRTGKWHIDYDETGKRIEHVYEDSTIKLLGYESREEYIKSQRSWEVAIHPEKSDSITTFFFDMQNLTYP